MLQKAFTVPSNLQLKKKQFLLDIVVVTINIRDQLMSCPDDKAKLLQLCLLVR